METHIYPIENKVSREKIDGKDVILITKHSIKNNTLKVYCIPNFENSLKLI